jgi:hypothetical protein
MTYPASDDFTTTTNWVADRGTGASVGGRLRASATSTVVHVGNTASVDVMDQYSEVVIATCATGGSELGPYTRFQGTPTNYIAALAMTSSSVGTLTIYKYSGSFVVLSTTTGISVTLPATVRLTSIGTRHTASINGTDIATVEDAELSHGTAGTYVWAVSSVANAEAESWNADVPTALTTPYRVQSIGTAVATVANGPPDTLSISFTGAVKPVTGDKIIAYMARDNITNDPATGDSISTTPGSETYTRVALAQPSGTSTAAAGIVGIAFYADVVSTWSAGTNTLTATMPTGVADRVLYAEHWRNLGAIRGTADTSGSTTNASVTTTDPVSGDVVVAMSCWEQSSASTVTPDTDTSSGSWSLATPQLDSGGTTTASVKLITQFKIVTATGRLGQYNLGTAAVGVSANGLSRLGQYNLGTASLGLSAFGLSVGATPTNANLGTASLGLSAFSISGSRTLNSAALAFVANAIAQTRTFSKADLTIAATALDPLTVGAEPIGQGRTLPSASLGLTAYNFTYGGQVLPGASVALAAALLGSSRAMSAATLGVTAYGLTVAAVLATANLGNATVGFTANPLTLTDSILVIAASLGITANALGFTDSLNVGTATLGLTASNLADSETTTAASLGLSATGLASSRALGATTFSASGITTAGYALASASITAIANNLSLLGSFSLGTATVAFSAFNMTNQTTGQATLGRADFSVSAANLSVGLSAGLSASLAMSATNLARAAVVGTSSLSVAALGLSQLRTAALGLASLVTTAYDMSQSAPGSAALGSGTLLLSANPMTRFALLSAGLATVALDANAIQPKANVSGAVGSMSTAAQPMSSTRALAKGILDLTAYGFGTYRPSTLSTAALTITAYALSAQTGKSKGRISVRNGYVQFKTGGRGLTGPKVANPVSSFKTVGG